MQNEKKTGYKIKRTDEFIEWIKNLKDRQAKTAIITRILRIQEDGHFGTTKGVGDNISELKFYIGAGYRVYYTIQGDTVVFLLYGGDKSSKKQQQKDINTAKELLEQYKVQDDENS